MAFEGLAHIGCHDDAVVGGQPEQGDEPHPHRGVHIDPYQGDSIATFPEVIVGARISKTGDATPSPGDFQALSEPVSNSRSEPVQLHIDTVL